jgi:hypothetical protein
MWHPVKRRHNYLLNLIELIIDISTGSCAMRRMALSSHICCLPMDHWCKGFVEQLRMVVSGKSNEVMSSPEFSAPWIIYVTTMFVHRFK